MERVKFILNGCDISFFAEAPCDMTVSQLIKQCDRIKPDWCACGICSTAGYNGWLPPKPEIIFDYHDVRKTNEDVCCRIMDERDS